jgi:sugar phosphate isomerase/epimerase
MKLGFVSGLGNHTFEAMLDQAARLGVDGVEVNIGGWSTAPHFHIEGMKSSAERRNTFGRSFADRGLEVIALNANGNPLHPTDTVQSQCLDRNCDNRDAGQSRVCRGSGRR